MQGSKSAKSHRDNCILKSGRSGDLESFKEIAEARSRVRRDRGKRSPGHFCPFYVNVFECKRMATVEVTIQAGFTLARGRGLPEECTGSGRAGGLGGFSASQARSFPQSPRQGRDISIMGHSRLMDTGTPSVWAERRTNTLINRSDIRGRTALMYASAIGSRDIAPSPASLRSLAND